MMSNYILKFYREKNGFCPIEDFLDRLNEKMRVKVVRELQLLEEFGSELRMPHSRLISNGIFELRVKYSSDIVRVFFFFDHNKIIILTNGYIKKQQKLSKKDFELAMSYKSAYLNGRSK